MRHVGLRLLALSISGAGWAKRGATHTHTDTLQNCRLFPKFITNVVPCSSLPNPHDEILTLCNLILMRLMVLPSSIGVSSRSHGLHGTWQRAGRGGSSEKNGPAKPSEGRPDPQTSRLEEETPTATSLPQGAHAVLKQGGFFAFKAARGEENNQRRRLKQRPAAALCLAEHTFCQVKNVAILQRTRAKALTNILNHKC